ncbi:MAG: TonB-dependent receptor, partial [Opitutaceae bacterium]|nr:TonB-dependent receptor [Opitutaceae bacterium]
IAARAQSPADESGAIEGVVYNITNGLPLGRAKVTVKDAQREALTDDYGHFFFSGLPSGEYQMEVSYLGFKSQGATVLVRAGRTATRDFQLAREGAAAPADDSSIVLLERFTVVADQAMTAQALAMNEQRHASNIKNVVAFEELGEQGQENIGNYVRFLPGVVIMDDGENPGTVALGGFGPEMSNIQLDGGDVASTGAGLDSSRTLAIQDVPMVNVERIEVTKVPTPDMPASGLGGSMNIVTKRLLGLKSPSFSYQMYMNFNNRTGFTFDGGPRQATSPASPKYMQPSFNASISVPLNKWLAFGVGASRTWRQRPTDDTPNEQANWNLRTVQPDGLVKDIALIEALWSQKSSVATTENIQANVEMKLARNDTLSLGFQRRNTAEQTSDNYMVARFGTGTGDGSYIQSGAKAGRLELDSRNNYESSTETNHLTLQYRHLGAKWRVTAKAVYSAAERVRDSMNKGYFGSLTTTTPSGTYNLRGEGIDEGDSILPASYVLTGTDGTPVAGFDPYDANGYSLSSATEGYGVYKTGLLTGRADVEHIFGANFSLKAGGACQRQEKDDRRINNTYTFHGDERGKAVSAYGLVDESIDVKMNGNRVHWVSPVKTWELFAADRERNGGLFTLDSTAWQTEAQNSKRMIEDISAAYLRFDLRVLDNRMGITGGLRYEKTRLDGWSVKEDGAAIFQRDENGVLMRDENGVLIRKPEAATYEGRRRLVYQERAHHEGQDYGGIYPSLNINATLTDNLVLRFAYARTIGRPNVSYVVAGITIPDPDGGDEDESRTITVGNPGLKPWTADSFHLTLDTYEMKGGYGSIGVYRKYVSNFFDRRYLPVTEESLKYYNIPDTDRDLMLSRNYRLRRWQNVGDAQLTGLELSYRQDLFFLPAWLRKTQVWVNYTHLAVGGANAPDFMGFTPDVFSCGLNFIRPRWSVRLTCAYQAETKKSSDYNPDTTYVNRYPPETYTWQGAYTKYGVTAEYALSRNLIFYMNWDNVFARDRMFYRRAPDTPAWAARSQRFVIPATIMAGVKGRF